MEEEKKISVMQDLMAIDDVQMSMPDSLVRAANSHLSGCQSKYRYSYHSSVIQDCFVF